MSRLKLFPNSTPFVTFGVLLLFLLQPGHKAAGTPTFDPRAYIERGNRVEQHYQAYSKRLAKHYAALLVAVKEHAPDLLPNLQPREPVLQGYQILPHIIPDATAEIHAHASPVAYSWPWTDRLIENELREINRSEIELRHTAKANSTEHRAVLQNLAQNYEQQSRRLRNIQAHVQYNRLWQAAIAADRSRYDRETALLSDVLERQRVIDRLNRLDGNVETTRVSVVDAPLGKAELASSLRQRKALLSRRIDQTMGQVQSPNFIEVENLDYHWIFHVPLVTDIDDGEYVAAVKKIIENSWQLKDGRNNYRVELDVTFVSADALYVKDKPNTGQRIDIRRHLKRFPLGVAILTTGALTTHVQGYAIVLGPHPIAPRVLAHEFGHILGFRDRYVRGYKNLGEHGFQVIEVVEDQDDIMAATARGRVHRGHFLKLRQRRVAPASQHSGQQFRTKVRRTPLESNQTRSADF